MKSQTYLEAINREILTLEDFEDRLTSLPPILPFPSNFFSSKKKKKKKQKKKPSR